MLDGEKLKVASHEKDLGIVVDHPLKSHLHTSSVAFKANQNLGIIRKFFEYLNINSLPRLCYLICRYPFFIGYQRMLVKVQRCAIW